MRMVGALCAYGRRAVCVCSARGVRALCACACVRVYIIRNMRSGVLGARLLCAQIAYEVRSVRVLCAQCARSVCAVRVQCTSGRAILTKTQENNGLERSRNGHWSILEP